LSVSWVESIGQAIYIYAEIVNLMSKSK
jgi:hypothetical protein